MEVTAWQTRHMARSVRYVALLGGVNVGGHRVTMERLRGEVTSLGYEDVSTFIASGNVVFTAPSAADHDERLERGLEAALGWPVPTFIRTAAQVVAAVDLRPFGDVPAGHTHMIAFCRTEPSHEIERHSDDHEQFEVHRADLHWHLAGGLMSSSLTLPTLAKVLGQRCTTRNVNSLTKLAAMLR
jgi:uncharacterized protein (DUF1697 family)